MGTVLGLLGPNFWPKIFLQVLNLPDIRHRPELQSCTISKKINDANLRKWQKPLVFFQNATLRTLARYKQKENMQYEYDIKYDINII